MRKITRITKKNACFYYVDKNGWVVEMTRDEMNEKRKKKAKSKK
jgi:cupin superfamily acireductone dioxygenase involved in methionine salvage